MTVRADITPLLLCTVYTNHQVPSAWCMSMLSHSAPYSYAYLSLSPTASLTLHHYLCSSSDTVSTGVTVELVEHQGRPNMYSSAVDSNPGMHGYALQSRTNCNAIITTDPAHPAHVAGRQYFSVFCEQEEKCPALLTLRTSRSIWNTVVDQDTYTTTTAYLRRLPGDCRVLHDWP